MKPTTEPTNIELDPKKELISDNGSILPEINTDVAGIISEIEKEKIEKNKNKLDLKPSVDFVSENIGLYETGLEKILHRSVSEETEEWVRKIKFNAVEDIIRPQVSYKDCKFLLSRMPEALIKLSKLSCVSYNFESSEKHLLLLPIYDGHGNFSGGYAIDSNEFPRKTGNSYKQYHYENGVWEWKDVVLKEDDHPSRILVGYSEGNTIYPSVIPKSISKNKRAVYLYQIHVFLHEFFHTIKPEDDILLETDGEHFTFKDWWKTYEELVLSGKEPKCVSSYANTYFDKLNSETKEKSNGNFTNALEENICEAFVAYQLGIISNDDGWTSFKDESFGNVGQLTKYTKGESESANLKWILMNKLCRSKIIRGLK